MIRVVDSVGRPLLAFAAVAVTLLSMPAGMGTAEGAEIALGYSGLQADGSLTHGGGLGFAFFGNLTHVCS